MRHLILTVNPPKLEGGGYHDYAVYWEEAQYIYVEETVNGMPQGVGGGPNLNYEPDPGEWYPVTESDGTKRKFKAIQAFPYAELLPDEPAPDPDPDPEPEHPADGTYLRSECNGVKMQQVLADGNGGERWGNVLEYNSASCGYVPPVYGCTDPEAENYNPDANTDDNSCVYAPKVYTEVKTIVVRPCTPGVFLRWLNSLGGVEGWLFTGKVSYPFSAEATGEYTLASGLKGAAQKNGNTNMVIRTSGLNFNQYKALCEVYTSQLVWLHKEGEEPEQVYVVPGSVDPDPGKKSYELAVELWLTPPNS